MTNSKTKTECCGPVLSSSQRGRKKKSVWLSQCCDGVSSLTPCTIRSHFSHYLKCPCANPFSIPPTACSWVSCSRLCLQDKEASVWPDASPSVPSVPSSTQSADSYARSSVFALPLWPELGFGFTVYQLTRTSQGIGSLEVLDCKWKHDVFNIQCLKCVYNQVVLSGRQHSVQVMKRFGQTAGADRFISGISHSDDSQVVM